MKKVRKKTKSSLVLSCFQARNAVVSAGCCQLLSPTSWVDLNEYGPDVTMDPASKMNVKVRSGPYIHCV